MQQGDVKARLKDLINDHINASGPKHKDDEYLDHDGDGSEGNCTYMCKGDIRQAPYEISNVGGKSAANIDFDSSSNVVPVTQYVPEAEDDDHYTGMQEAKLYAEIPAYERFIPKKTRDAADSGSFAGKGRSFPILKQQDVSAALHSIGRAGPGNYSADTIRANIKKIAKAKGFALPDSLKDDGKESSTWRPDGLLLKESAVSFLEEPKRLAEGFAADYPIKLIQPGRGSSGYYPPEVLQRDGPQIFKAGTQMFWNHPTDAEEAERPEGNLDHLAAVTTSDARYDENGKDGPGLYARAKVFSDYADKVQEKGKHIGISIRAGGSRDDMATAPDGRRGVITALKNAQSVDFVTKPGAGGKVFTESQHSKATGGDMDEQAIKQLIKESVSPLQQENQRLRESLARAAAPEMIREALTDIRLPAASMRRIVEKVSAVAPIGTDGQIDRKKLNEMIEAEAIEQGRLLQELGFGNVAGLGARMSEKDMQESVKDFEKASKASLDELVDIFVGPKLGKDADPKAREARKMARNAFREGRAA